MRNILRGLGVRDSGLEQRRGRSSTMVVTGRIFHTEKDVQLPWQFFYIRHRVRPGAAAEMEVDLYAAAGAKVWIGKASGGAAKR